MKISRKMVAGKIAGYLRHKIDLEELVDWAERAMMDSDFDEADLENIRNAVARLGVADVREFGLMWEDCETMLRELGYRVDLKIVAA